MKKIVIAGTAPRTKDDAPFDDKSFEIWGLAWKPYKRVDRTFQLHKRKDWENSHPKDAAVKYADHINKINPNRKICYVQEKTGELDKEKVYPIEEVNKMLTSYGGSDMYFNSSVAYMIALAIYEKAAEIHVYGVDMIAADEYEYQRPNLEYLLGLACGLGIKVFIPEKSALCKTRKAYGYEVTKDEMTSGFITTDFLEERKQMHRRQFEEKEKSFFICEGAIRTCQSFLRKDVTPDLLKEELDNLNNTQQQITDILKGLDAAIKEVDQLQNYTRHQEQNGDM